MDPTATTSSSTTDVTAFAGWDAETPRIGVTYLEGETEKVQEVEGGVEAAKKEANRVQVTDLEADAAQTEVAESETEKKKSFLSRCAFWKKGTDLAADATDTEVAESETEKQKSLLSRCAFWKNPWPLWKKLALAGGILFIILALGLGLGVGLGVGLAKHRSSESRGGDDDGQATNSGSSSGSTGGSNGGANGSGSGSGKGSPGKANKLVVYWGAKLNTVSLDTVCSDPSYDIINISFLSYFFAEGQYPRLAIPSLNGSSAAQRLAGAISLQDGTSLIPAIQKCQANGKLVLLSMGGAAGYADVRLSSNDQGVQVADTIWNLFLGGTKKPEIRPFGNVILDGVDFDNESGSSLGYGAMAQQFRSNFAKDSSKRYYMTAAPQCPFKTDPDELALFQHLDYVSVQFYNNNVCNMGQPGFEKSVQRWSAAIGNTSLLIGALASDADGDEGYIDSNVLGSELKRVAAMNLPNYGGVMLWEAELATNNSNYQKKVKALL